MANVCLKNALSLITYSFIHSFSNYLSVGHIPRAILNSGDTSQWEIHQKDTPERTPVLKSTGIGFE